MTRRMNAACWVLVLVFIAVALIVAGELFLRQQEEMRRVSKRAQELQGRYEEVIEESRQLDRLLNQVRSTEQIEEQARNQLGMVRPGEIVYKDAQDGD